MSYRYEPWRHLPLRVRQLPVRWPDTPAPRSLHRQQRPPVSLPEWGTPKELQHSRVPGAVSQWCRWSCHGECGDHNYWPFFNFLEILNIVDVTYTQHQTFQSNKYNCRDRWLLNSTFLLYNLEKNVLNKTWRNRSRNCFCLWRFFSKL